MTDIFNAEQQISYVTNFNDLVAIPFEGATNAICWSRSLAGDFAEIVNKIDLHDNIVTIEPAQLSALQLSEQGQMARNIVLNDFELLQAHGGLPVLNVIKYYDRDADAPFFPTDVYSFHADYSPIPTNTFLCTYYGSASEILPNAQAQKKILIPEIRNQLKQLYQGPEEGFDAFLTEHFYDLHYQALPDANLINLGNGNLWRLAVDCPQSKVAPCVHRAPEEKYGQPRLLMIC